MEKKQYGIDAPYAIKNLVLISIVIFVIAFSIFYYLSYPVISAVLIMIGCLNVFIALMMLWRSLFGITNFM